MKIAPALLLLLLVSACASLPSGGAPANDPVESTPEMASPEPPETRLISLPFRLDIALSPYLADALDAAGQHIGLTAQYFGRPRGQPQPDLPVVQLGGETREVSVRNQSIILAGTFDAALASRESEGDARVFIEVYALPADIEGPQMICSRFEQPLPITVETGAHVDCELASG